MVASLVELQLTVARTKSLEEWAIVLLRELEPIVKQASAERQQREMETKWWDSFPLSLPSTSWELETHQRWRARKLLNRSLSFILKLKELFSVWTLRESSVHLNWISNLGHTRLEMQLWVMLRLSLFDLFNISWHSFHVSFVARVRDNVPGKSLSLWVQKNRLNRWKRRLRRWTSL
jgi:hypothetical protein